MRCKKVLWTVITVVLLLFVTLFYFAPRTRATTYTDITVDGTINDTTEWAADEKFTSFVGSFDAFYITWNGTYLYFGFDGGTVSSDRYVVAIDTDPGGMAGDGGEWGGVSFPLYGRPDYIVEYNQGAIYTRGGVNGNNVLRGVDGGANTLELGIPRSELGSLAPGAEIGLYLYAGYDDSGSARTFAFFPPGHGNTVSGSGTVTAVTEWHFATMDAGRAPTTYGRYQSDIWTGATVNVSAGENFNDVILDGGTLVGPTDGTFNVAGDFYYDATNGGIFTLNNCTVNFDGSGTIKGGHSIGVTFNHISIANGATLTADSNLRVQGDWINSGTFNANTGTKVEFWGSTGNPSRVLGPSTTTFDNVTISCSDCGENDTYGVDFYDHDYDSRAHIAGTLQLNQHTFVASEEDGSSTSCVAEDPYPPLGPQQEEDQCDGTPIYDAGSTLLYNNSGTFESAAEWWPDDTNPTCGTDKGMPYDVVIQNSTTVNINAAFDNNSKDPSYLDESNKTACGSVTINSGSTLQSTAGILTVKDDWTRSGTFTHNSGTIRFHGNGGDDSTQTATGDTTFYNLILDMQSGVDAYFGATTMTIENSLTKDSGNMDPGTSLFVFTGSPSAILGSGQKNFYDLEISGTTNHTSGGSVHVDHSFVNNATFTEGADQDIYFDGGGSIGLSGSGTTTFGSVWVQSSSTLNAGTHSFWVVGDRFAVLGSNTFNGGTATVTFANSTGTVLNPSLSNLGAYNFNHLVIDSGAVVLGPVYGSKTINVAGTWTNNGTYTHNEGKVVFNGSSAQTIGGSSTTTFYDLTVDNASGVALGQDEEVDGTLYFSAGRLTLGAYDLTLGSAAPAVGGTLDATRMVVADSSGVLCKEYDGTGSFAFPVGDATGTAEYAPAVLDFTSGTFSSGEACVRLVDAKHPNNNSPANYLTRYWTVASSGITDFSCTATFAYVDADIEGTEDSIYGLKYDGGTWTTGSLVNELSNSFAMTAGNFSDFTGGNGPTAVNLLSFTARPGLCCGQGCILLAWETASEQDNVGFHLYRSTRLDALGERVNETLIPSSVPGGEQGSVYEFLDELVLPGVTYYYTLEDVDFSGNRTAHGPVAITLWRAYLPLVVRSGM